MPVRLDISSKRKRGTLTFHVRFLHSVRLLSGHFEGLQKDFADIQHNVFSNYKCFWQALQLDYSVAMPDATNEEVLA